jgi:hypothetical protein
MEPRPSIYTEFPDVTDAEADKRMVDELVMCAACGLRIALLRCQVAIAFTRETTPCSG